MPLFCVLEKRHRDCDVLDGMYGFEDIGEAAQASNQTDRRLKRAAG
jgi:hypothetical protein